MLTYRPVEIARETEGEISRYLASVSMINCAVGVAVGVVVGVQRAEADRVHAPRCVEEVGALTVQDHAEVDHQWRGL